ncbi:MAG: plastocyanin/azurin family copper-binding protein [Nitrososphaeraceae archaeon]|nr:plastocyanin/azurin family copper-binding protein [Nitrososphaeraceae archaeon]
MTDWDLMTPGIGLTSIGIVGVGISLSGIAKTFIDGMHAVTLLTMFIGMIFLASGLFKDGFPTSGRAKSATFVTLGFLVTFGFAAAVTVSTQVPSIFSYIGLMLLISIPATVLAVASYRGAQHLKAMAVIFIGAAIVGGSTFYAFGLVTPKPPVPEEEQEEEEGGESPAAEEPADPPANTINATILPGSSAQGNPDYDPDPITISQGDGVQWTNEDNAPHTVTSRQEGVFDTGLINPADAWLLNSAEIAPAEYEYYCTLHPFMVATLVVSNGAAPPSQSSENDTATQGAVINNQSGTSANNTAAGNNTAAISNSPPASGSVTTVSIPVGASVPTNGQFYEPNNVDTSVGSMVTWVNDDTAPHTVTSGIVENNRPTPDGSFDSGIINPGDSFPFVFDKAGEYPYYCTIHPFMTGKVTSN